MRRLFSLAVLSTLLALPAVSQATPDVVRVATGNGLMPTLEPLVDQYQLETGNKVLLIAGDSDEMATEIENGAPYDLYFADNTTGPQKLHRLGRGEAPKTYACRQQPQQYVVLVSGPRHELAARFLGYLDSHRAALSKAGYHLPGESACVN